MTNLVDTVIQADGTPANGQVTLYWPMFMQGPLPITQGQKTFEIVDGALDLSLVPTTTAQPSGSYYTATFQLENGAVYDEYWTVPDSAVPVKLNNVRAMFPPAPGLFVNVNQLVGGNAQVGQFIGWNDNQWVPMNVTTLSITPNTIGLTVGNAGSDINVSGGGVAMLGSGFTLNIPDAGPTSRGVVNTGAQTFAGNKIFLGGAVFEMGIYFTPSTGASLGTGALVLNSQSVFQMTAPLVISNPGGPATLTASAATLNHVGLTGGTVSPAVANPGSVALPGQETILLPKGNAAHGIGVDVNDWLWLGSGTAFAALRPDAAWVANWIDLSPYQHPIQPGPPTSPSQASLVFYQDATQWLGMGVDVGMRIWFRTSGGIVIENLPTSYPGAGTRQLWADPNDSYRVKWAF